MKITRKQKGSVMLIAMFVIALMTTLVIGIVQMNTEEIQLTQNQVYALDAVLDLEEGITSSDLEKGIMGHVLDKAELIGLYKKH